MKKSIKAALISTLVYPGAGHLSLNKRLKGYVFICIFTIPLYLFIQEVAEKTQQIMMQVRSGTMPLDPNAISASITQSEGSSSTVTFMLLIWVLAAFDAYRLGNKADKIARNKEQDDAKLQLKAKIEKTAKLDKTAKANPENPKNTENTDNTEK